LRRGRPGFLACENWHTKRAFLHCPHGAAPSHLILRLRQGSHARILAADAFGGGEGDADDVVENGGGDDDDEDDEEDGLVVVEVGVVAASSEGCSSCCARAFSIAARLAHGVSGSLCFFLRCLWLRLKVGTVGGGVLVRGRFAMA